MAKRKTNKAMRKISGVALLLFIISGILIIFNWVSTNKNAIFFVSGFFLVFFVVTGAISFKKVGGNTRKAIRSRFG